MHLQIWEWFLLIGAIYVAVLSLVGLMRRRRADLVAELTQEAVAAQNRRREEEARKKAEEKRKRMAERRKAG